MAYGKDVSSDSMNSHKAMAGAGMKSGFGVGKMPGREAMHPDMKAGTGRAGAMADSERMPPTSGKAGSMMQAAPDHGMGMGHPDHFSRAGKIEAMAKAARYEGSRADEKNDRRMAKKTGVSMKTWEKSKADKKMDAAGQRKMNAKRKGTR